MTAFGRNRFMRVITALTLCAATFAALVERARADDQKEPGNRDAEERRQTERLIQSELPRWKITTGPEPRALQLEPKPILRWTNPATGRLFGEIYVWTVEGRPEAVMSLYKAWEPAWGFAAELHSLSLEKAVAKRDENVIWNCAQPGVVIRSVPEAPAPAEASRQRLQQMRAIAADFSAVLIDRRRNPDGERQSLRLLTNPLFRYSCPDKHVADGAIFAFVVGTDAEVLLLLESRAERGKSNWQYALARLNRDELAAQFRDEEVWRVEGGVYGERDKPYFLVGLPE